MQINESPTFRSALLEKIAQREFSERTGTHCSDLLYCLNKQALRRRLGDVSTEEETLVYSWGWALQRWLTGKDEDEPQREVDGIIVTCDALVGDPPEVCPWELKASKQSSTKPIEENYAWIRQLMAQCYIVGTTKAYLTRFELLGDWKTVYKPKGYKDWSAEMQAEFNKEHPCPDLHAWEFIFTREELDRNWQWLKERKVLFEHLLETGELVPKAVAIPSGQDWEANYCKFKGKECQEC